MIEAIFWGTTILAIGLMLCRIIFKKDFFSIYTYIFIGIYIPLILSFCDWSFYHVQEKGENFYFIFVEFALVLIISIILPQNHTLSLPNIQIVRKRQGVPVELYNIVFCAFVLIENYYVSGYWVPSFHGVDVHTLKMPLAYFITTAAYIVGVLNIFEYFITHKKRYFVYMAVSFMFNMITKSSRTDLFIGIVQIVSLYGFFYLSQKTRTSRSRAIKKKNTLKLVLIILCIILLILPLGIRIGYDRSNHYGLYNYRYSDGIRYTGPEYAGELLAFYYGYFALSFDNLAYNIMNISIHPNWIGLNTFRTLYFGVLQFDNLLGLNGSEAYQANKIRTAGAAISTVFLDMYYDYSYFVIIPFIISFIIYFYLRKKVCCRKVKVASLILYFYWVPMWMFFSFDNRVYDYPVLWHTILIVIIFNWRYTIFYDGLKNGNISLPLNTTKPAPSSVKKFKFIWK